MAPADTINTQSVLGRNATPLIIVNQVRNTLGSIELDPASDPEINQGVKADRIFTFEEDGYSKPWTADTCWLNPPGTSYTSVKGKSVTIAGTQWIRKLYSHYKEGSIKHAIALCYRAGSLGSLGTEILNDSMLCFTAKGATHVNGSGRISFELLEGSTRLPQDHNTQSSVFLLFSDSRQIKQSFYENFDQSIGVVLSAI